MDALLPQMVHANMAVVKSGGSLALGGASQALEARLRAADISNTVLAGMVAKKAKEGVALLLSNNHYSGGVDSVAW